MAGKAGRAAAGVGLLAAGAAGGPVGLALAGIGALIGGTLAASAASKQKKAVKKAAGINFASVNQQIGQSRLALIDANQIASHQLQSQVGAIRAAAPIGIGQDLTRYIAQSVLDAEADTYIRRFNESNQEKALELQKQTIAANAKAGMVSPTTAGIQGAIGGAQTGLSVAGAVQGL